MSKPTKCEEVVQHYTTTCSDLYDCCSCGGNDCGCGYCWDCNACDFCKEEQE